MYQNKKRVSAAVSHSVQLHGRQIKQITGTSGIVWADVWGEKETEQWEQFKCIKRIQIE